MSNYGLNFGFLRSSEEVRLAEGRYKTPAASALLLGTPVEINPASAGYLKVATSNTSVPITGYCGLLLQELEFERSIYEIDAAAMDTFMYGVAKPNRLSLITGGAGTKVWFKNTAGSTRADGRVIAARTMWTTTGVAVGDELGWSGTTWSKVTGGVTGAWMKVTYVNATASYVEAVLLG
jgi:hypothetical protein